MRETMKWMLALSATLIAGGARATPPSGFSGTTIAQGRVEEIDVNNHQPPPGTVDGKLWLSIQKAQGLSDAYVQSNVWVPGGTTGWHTHPGHSLIIVTAGVITAYDGNDPSCTPHEYTAGMTFVDPGGDHVHLLRNEGSVDARTIAVQLIPAGAVRRIDAPAPGTCAF